MLFFCFCVRNVSFVARCLPSYNNPFVSFPKRFLSNVICSETKSFESIPGPKEWPVVGNALLFSPLGPYRIPQMLDAFSDLYDKYGSIVKLNMPGRPSVLVFNPDDIRTLFLHEGKYPQRPTFDALKAYRKEKFGCSGVVPDNGEEWYRLRKHIQHLLKLKTVHSYWSSHHEVARDFANHLKQKMDKNGVVHDFLQEAFLFSLEAIGIMCYGKRLNCLSQNSQEGLDVVKANKDFLIALGKTFNGPPIWKIWKTKEYKTIESTQDFMMSIGEKYLSDAKAEMSENPESYAARQPALFSLLTNDELSPTEVRIVITELFEGGIDATGTVLTMMLHDLAMHQDVQSEIFEALTHSTMTPGHMPPLLRAIMKETLRLHPTAAATSRFLDTSAIMSGFNVPKNTLVVGINPIISRMSSYFKNPNSFDPKRWVRKDPCHPYGTLPFGHGARMCPGRRIAEQEILVCVAEIIKNFKIVASRPTEIKMILTTNLIPSESIDLEFQPR